MATVQIDEVLDVYKQLAQNPSITSARISVTSNNLISIQSVWSQKNLERSKKQKFIKEFSFDTKLQPLLEGYPSDISSEILSSYSTNDELKAVLRDISVDGKTKQFIEIWNKHRFIKSYDLSAFDVHGEVYSGVTFSALHFSPDGTKLLYVAEKKLPKSEPFYKQKSKRNSTKTDYEPSRGTEYVFKSDWGEQLVGKHRSVIVVLNIAKDTIVPLDTVPDDFFPVQVIWAPNGKDVVGVAYKLNTRYLGLYACTNRESYIFHLKGKEFCKLTEENQACRSPRFSPDGKYLVWLERNLTPPHHSVQRLMYLKWNVSKNPDILVDEVKKYTIIENEKKFYGFYNKSLPKRCWSNDSKYLFLSSPQRSNVKSYIVNLESKLVTEINDLNGTSLSILDVKNNYIVFSHSSLLLPPQLVIGKIKFNKTGIEDISLQNCTTPFEIPNSIALMYDTTEYVHENNDLIKDFNFTYFGKKDGSEKSLPLVAVLHGGPHATYSNEFNLTFAVFAVLGYGVLLINYRGSIGLGGDNIDYILGKVGDSDVLDCITAIKVTLEKYFWLNPNKVCLYGGSHGGFLSAHLSGQYSEMFNAVVMRNPVIDLAVMFSITDIPDWCPSESGGLALGTLPETTPESNYFELIETMLKHSPILHADKVKAPTLIALGSKDLRVPASQGKLWYYRLKANNVKTKLFMYEDNHSLNKDETEIDFLINTVLWLWKHTTTN